MSWGRGVNNNTAGSLRMPTVAQFAEQRSSAAEARSRGCPSISLVVVPQEDSIECSPFVYVSPGGAATPIMDTLEREGRAYVYTHDHPHFVLRVASSIAFPPGTIALTEVQAMNHHVCAGEPYVWHLFDGWKNERLLSDVTLEVPRPLNVYIFITFF